MLNIDRYRYILLKVNRNKINIKQNNSYKNEKNNFYGDFCHSIEC
jgi:hypothetical protein